MTTINVYNGDEDERQWSVRYCVSSMGLAIWYHVIGTGSSGQAHGAIKSGGTLPMRMEHSRAYTIAKSIRDAGNYPQVEVYES